MSLVKSEPTEAAAVLDLSPLKGKLVVVETSEGNCVAKLEPTESTLVCLPTTPPSPSVTRSRKGGSGRVAHSMDDHNSQQSDGQGQFTDSDDPLNISSTNTNRFGRSFVNGRPLPESLRVKILSMSKEGVRPCEISRQLQVSHGCVSKILNRFSKTGSITPGRIGGSKPKVTTPDVVSMVHAYKQSRPHVYAWEIRRMLIKDGICSEHSAPSVSSINRIVRNRAPNESPGSSLTGNYEDEFGSVMAGAGDYDELDGGNCVLPANDSLVGGANGNGGPPASKKVRLNVEDSMNGRRSGNHTNLTPSPLRHSLRSSTTQPPRVAMSLNNNNNNNSVEKSTDTTHNGVSNGVLVDSCTSSNMPTTTFPMVSTALLSHNSGNTTTSVSTPLLLQVSSTTNPGSSVSLPLPSLGGCDLAALFQQPTNVTTSNTSGPTTSGQTTTCVLPQTAPSTLQLDLPLALAQALASASNSTAASNSAPTLLSLVSTPTLGGGTALQLQPCSNTNLASLLAAAVASSSGVTTSSGSSTNLLMNTLSTAATTEPSPALVLSSAQSSQPPQCGPLGNTSNLLSLLAATNPLLWSSLLNVEKLSVGDCHFMLDSEQKTHLIRYCGSSKWQMIGSCKTEPTSSTPTPNTTNSTNHSG